MDPVPSLTRALDDRFEVFGQHVTLGNELARGLARLIPPAHGLSLAAGGQPKLREAFSGMLNGIAPTGKSVKVLQFHSFRIRDGLIAEHAAVRDDMAMVQQLGLVRRP